MMFARLLVLLVMAGPAKIAKAEGLCGIFAVAEGARIFGEPPLFDELVSARFVGVEGSTIPQLVDAAGYCGLKAYPISNVGIDFIRNVPAPTILHVRNDIAFGPYTHWILLRESDGKFATISDSGVVAKVPLAELVCMMDGTAIMLSDDKSYSQVIAYVPEFVFSVRVFSLGLLIASLVDWTLRSNRIQYKLLGSVAVLLGSFVFAEWFNTPSLLGESRISYAIVESAFGYEFPSVSTSEIKSLIGSQDVVLVDTRGKASFNHGTIPSAKNLPIDSDFATLAEFAREHAGVQLVVFCQSERCGYAEHIAKRLAALGVKGIWIYREGMVGYANTKRD